MATIGQEGAASSLILKFLIQKLLTGYLPMYVFEKKTNDNCGFPNAENRQLLDGRWQYIPSFIFLFPALHYFSFPLQVLPI